MARTISILLQILKTVYERAEEDSRSQESSNRMRLSLESEREFELKLEGNRNLSPVGRKNEMTKSLETFFSNLDWFRAMQRETADQHRVFYEKLFVLPKSHRDPTIQELRHQELRSELRHLSQAERDKVYLAAAKANHVELLRAIQDDPGMTPLVTADLRRRADDLRAKQLDPAAHDTLVQVSEDLKTMQMLSREVEELVKEHGVDTTKVPLTDRELSEFIDQRVDQIFERDFGREVADRAKAARMADQQAVINSMEAARATGQPMA